MAIHTDFNAFMYKNRSDVPDIVDCESCMDWCYET